jgi:hypothetical protein
MSGQILDPRLRPAEPLWQRVPCRDVEDQPLSDFMMLIPRLSRAPDLRREQVYEALRTLCRRHARQLYYVDLNLRLNLLWISVNAAPGVIPRLVAEIRERIPEAVLVGHECGLPAVLKAPAPWYKKLTSGILRCVARRPELSPPGNGIR